MDIIDEIFGEEELIKMASQGISQSGIIRRLMKLLYKANKRIDSLNKQLAETKTDNTLDK